MPVYGLCLSTVEHNICERSYEGGIHTVHYKVIHSFKNTLLTITSGPFPGFISTSFHEFQRNSIIEMYHYCSQHLAFNGNAAAVCIHVYWQGCSGDNDQNRHLYFTTWNAHYHSCMRCHLMQKSGLETEIAARVANGAHKRMLWPRITRLRDETNFIICIANLACIVLSFVTLSRVC